MPLSTDDFALAVADSIASRSLTSCSRWAAYRRVMGEPFPGPYTWKYHPWVREMHDSWAPFTYVMKGAQLGVTEAAINRALYTLDRLKRDVLYVMPTMTAASDFSKSRFGPALSLSPYLKSIFTDTNAVNLKRAGNNCLYIRGSRGKGSLISIPVSELILDEVDRMDKEQIALALERLSGQLHKHVWGISTPTVPEHGIHKLYKDTTQEHYMFRCPHCGKMTELIWPDCVEIAGEFATDVRCKESYLKCKECGHKLEHAAKPDFLSGAQWVSMAPNANKDVRGFHINQLYSFTVTPAELVSSFLAGQNDEFQAKEFHNSKLGIPFVGDKAKVTEAMIANAVRAYSMDDVRPARSGRLITLGADQGSTCHAVVCEWLLENYLSEELGESAICKVLWAGTFLEEDWARLDELMREWQVLYAVVDADPNINDARRFCRRFPGYAATTRYRGGRTGKEVTVSDEECGAPMLTVDRSSWLAATLNRFKANPTRILLPRDIPEQFKTHVQNLTRTVEKDEKGTVQTVFLNTGADHYSHALTYAGIALNQAPIDNGGPIRKFM